MTSLLAAIAANSQMSSFGTPTAVEWNVCVGGRHHRKKSSGSRASGPRHLVQTCLLRKMALSSGFFWQPLFEAFWCLT